MLHEVIFSLWHAPSSLLTEKYQEEWINMIETKDFLHPAEMQLLQRIMKLSLEYHKINRFRTLIEEKHANLALNKNTDDADIKIEETEQHVKYGLYIEAFCRGLEDVLKPYRKEIIKLESTVLENPQLTLGYVLFIVEKYATLFEALKSMLRTVCVEKIYGCLLVGRLHSYTNNTTPMVAEGANKIVQSMNTVFYRHLANWIIYANLFDVYEEFFICDCMCDDENFINPEDLQSGRAEATAKKFKNNRIRKPSRVRKFTIRAEMLPSFLEIETAESILFMGRIVWILQNDPKQASTVTMDKFRRDVWEGESAKYYKKIRELKTLERYETCIAECRVKLTKYLWNVMVNEVHLLDHLQLVRDYFALGRGELFHQFIMIADHPTKQTPNEQICRNLNSQFIETARKMYGQNDQTYLKFEIAFKRDAQINASNPFMNIKLNFDINWPLHIIFHPEVMSLYNKLFSFLLRVKKTNIDLHLLWFSHKKKKIVQGVWTLRHNLMFLINNIEYYLQVDVIESHFSQLKEAIKNANEFNDIIRLHSTFLSNLLSKTFVMSLDTNANKKKRSSLYQLPDLNMKGNNMVYNIILEVLKLCDDFCFLANTWESILTEPELKMLEEFQSRFDTAIETLLRSLFSLHKQVSGHHLLQLLHRLDYNRWYTKSKPDLNLTMS